MGLGGCTGQPITYLELRPQTWVRFRVLCQAGPGPGPRLLSSGPHQQTSTAVIGTNSKSYGLHRLQRLPQYHVVTCMFPKRQLRRVRQRRTIASKLPSASALRLVPKETVSPMDLGLASVSFPWGNAELSFCGLGSPAHVSLMRQCCAARALTTYYVVRLLCSRSRFPDCWVCGAPSTVPPGSGPQLGGRGQVLIHY